METEETPIPLVRLAPTDPAQLVRDEVTKMVVGAICTVVIMKVIPAAAKSVVKRVKSRRVKDAVIETTATES